MDFSERILQFENKLAIQELTQSFLKAADNKDHVAMANHFTNTGILTSITDDDKIVLEGTKGISDGFAKILESISIAYHMQGQHEISLNGDNASGTSYCFVTLIDTDREEYVRKIWAVYEDEYLKVENKWLIDSRLATITWEERENLNKKQKKS